jgi:hypothetical protein
MQKFLARLKSDIREIITTIVEICAAVVISIGVSINWGKGTGLIVGGILALILSYLASLAVNE